MTGPICPSSKKASLLGFKYQYQYASNTSWIGPLHQIGPIQCVKCNIVSQEDQIQMYEATIINSPHKNYDITITSAVPLVTTYGLQMVNIPILRHASRSDNSLLSYFDTYQQVCCPAGAQRSQYEPDWYSVYNHQQHIAITISNTIRPTAGYT